MSVYGAMNAAVSGMKAQSKSLGNISDNIANSQTIGYKRVDTSFSDLVTQSSRSNHTPGGVIASPRYRHSLQGDIAQTQITTNMAISGAGFFVVSKANSVTPAGVDMSDQMVFTRRGDFEVDRFGFMRNGSNYYLRGRPVIDQDTLNTSDIMQPVRIQKDVMLAQQTSRIKYNLNLPSNSDNFSLIRTTARVTTQAADGPPAVTQRTELAINGSAFDQDTLDITLTVAGVTNTYTFTYTDGTPAVQTDNFDDYMAQLETFLGTALGGEFGAATWGGAGTNTITLDAAAPGTAAAVTINSIKTATADPVTAANQDENLLYSASGSFSGGAVTVYDDLGNPTDLQFRWAKAGDNQWNLLAKDPNRPAGTEWFQVNPAAAPIAFTNGLPSVDNLTLTPASGNDIVLDFTTDGETGMGSSGETALTQFYDEDISVYRLDQDGYSAGVLSDVFINDYGFIVANYDNGRSKVLYQVPLALFNSPNEMQRLDGGAFDRTPESGDPLYSEQGNAGAGAIIASANENSNVDIADEFTKMIVTQRAYSANSKTVRTADDMLEEVVNLKR